MIALRFSTAPNTAAHGTPITRLVQSANSGIKINWHVLWLVWHMGGCIMDLDGVCVSVGVAVVNLCVGVGPTLWV